MPRRYDLATLLVVMLAFSLLFAGLQLVKAPLLLFWLIVGLAVVIGLGQALFSTTPRVASAVAGAGWFVAWFLGLAAQDGHLALYLSPIVFVAMAGALCGYIAGALIGGVFLVADSCRKYLTNASHSRERS